MSTIAFTAAAASEPGAQGTANYDAAHLTTDPLLAVVADGMGKSDGSAMAGRTIVDLVTRRAADTIDAIADAVAEAHELVAAFGDRTGELAGCTLTALAQCTDGLWVVQLGDSRLYRLRGRLLELITVDHTMAWLGAVHGWWPHDSWQARRARYQLTRYVGHDGRPAPDLLRLDVRPGDVLLACTDGISDQLPYATIAELLSGHASPHTAARALVDAADAAGGADNATAVVVHAI